MSLFKQLPLSFIKLRVALHVQTLTPLLSVAATEDVKALEKAEPVESCSLHVRVDASTGTVAATQTKGSTTSASRSVLWGRIQLAFVLVLPFALIALYYYSGYFTEWYTDRQHAAWLADFYAKNAPEVSVHTCAAFGWLCTILDAGYNTRLSWLVDVCKALFCCTCVLE